MVFIAPIKKPSLFALALSNIITSEIHNGKVFINFCSLIIANTTITTKVIKIGKHSKNMLFFVLAFILRVVLKIFTKFRLPLLNHDTHCIAISSLRKVEFLLQVQEYFLLYLLNILQAFPCS